MDRNVLLALGAAQEAWRDAGINGMSTRLVSASSSARRSAACRASSEQHGRPARARGRPRSPFFIPSVLVDSASGQIAISLGLRGPNYAPVSACATGSHAVGEGAELIRRGAADAVLAGGTESCIHPLILAGFCAMRGLVAEDEDPSKASRPFDATRAGFVMGEGACILVLEELESAQARGATIYAEVLGYGASNDAHHMAQPDPESVGVAEMMTRRTRAAPASIRSASATSMRTAPRRRSATRPRRARSRTFSATTRASSPSPRRNR